MNQSSINDLGEIDKLHTELAHIARLALAEQTDDVQMFVMRLEYRYRTRAPKLAEQLNEYLQAGSPRVGNPLRQALPVDDESRLSR